MCGGLAPIGDLLKTEVYALARSINERAGRALIPEATLTKPPSAELRPNQVDQDSLPPYELLDRLLDLYIVHNLGAGEIVARGFDAALVERVIAMVGRAEYKRRQAAPVIKVSSRAFGMGRRVPIARALYEASTGQRSG
jgi:NAD+ synthase (glutamine-hydrolysing)